MGAKHLNAPIVGMAATPDGRGYWLVASDGGIFSFGDAGYHGSMGGKHLNRPIVGMTPTPSGAGYWLVASDGGIFAFGTAEFFGSTGAMHLNAPIVGMDSPDSGGYWLVASDGGIFAFGDAGFFGSTGAIHLNAPIVGIKATASGAGYWLAAADGGIFAFGERHLRGLRGRVPPQPTHRRHRVAARPGGPEVRRWTDVPRAAQGPCCDRRVPHRPISWRCPLRRRPARRGPLAEFRRAGRRARPPRWPWAAGSTGGGPRRPMAKRSHTPSRTWAKPSTVCRVTSWPSPCQATSIAAIPDQGQDHHHAPRGRLRQASDTIPRYSARAERTRSSSSGGHSSLVSGEAAAWVAGP